MVFQRQDRGLRGHTHPRGSRWFRWWIRRHELPSRSSGRDRGRRSDGCDRAGRSTGTNWAAGRFGTGRSAGPSRTNRTRGSSPIGPWFLYVRGRPGLSINGRLLLFGRPFRLCDSALTGGLHVPHCAPEDSGSWKIRRRRPRRESGAQTGTSCAGQPRPIEDLRGLGIAISMDRATCEADIWSLPRDTRAASPQRLSGELQRN